MPIENKKKKTDIATTLTKGESELKQGIQEGDSELKARNPGRRSRSRSSSIKRRISNYKQ